ncbi:hypothetical protein, partial [Pseudonocardia alni]|uniref:hypothetical protein n=1 Tax=Pseudonocardia alni TaxID=33907 RepID=UPI0033FCF259
MREVSSGDSADSADSVAAGAYPDGPPLMYGGLTAERVAGLRRRGLRLEYATLGWKSACCRPTPRSGSPRRCCSS